MIQAIRKVWRSLRRTWGQVRWQVAACYVLPGVVSVLLVATFGFLVLNMLARRGTINVVERQVYLQVELTAHSVDSLASTLAQEVRGSLDPQWGDRLASITAHALPGSGAFVRCQAADGTSATYSYPENLRVTIPDWLSEDSFRGVVFEGGEVAIHAWARRVGPECAVEALLHVPLENELAEIISSAAGVEVGVPGPPAGRTGQGLGQGPGRRRMERSGGRGSGRRTPPAESDFLGRWLPGFQRPGPGDYLPVVVPARNWETGALEDKVVFRVRSSPAAIFRQLAQYGQTRALWVFLLPLMATLFVLVELGALWIAVRLARRISGAVDDLSMGAGEIGKGNLAHRIAVLHDDQLGRLANSFNDMAGSLERLVAETKEKERLQQELAIAKEVQQSLFPATIPDVPGAQLAATCQPARMVSGDLYDLVELGENRVGLLCADVAGKGISAALLVSSLQALVRTAVRPGDVPTPAKLIARLNSELCDRLPGNRFITLFWAEFDAGQRLLRYANAGHNPPLLFHGDNDTPERLEAGGMPVGMFSSARYEERELRLPPGSLLAIYTDGIPEALNPAEEEFGDENWEDLCRIHCSAPANEFVNQVIQALQNWVSEAEQFDDMTLVALKAV